MAKEHHSPPRENDDGTLTEGSTRQLAAVEAVANIVARVTDAESLFEALLGTLAELLTADVAAVFMRVDDSEEVTLRYQVLRDKKETLAQWWGEIPRRVMEDSQPATFTDASPDVRAIAGVPLTFAGQITGALLIGHRLPREYCQEEVNILSVVGAQLGLVVENVRLHERSSRQLKGQDVLFEVNRGIAATLALDALLDLIVHSALKTIRAAGAVVVHLLDEESGVLSPRAASFIPRILPSTAGKTDMRKGRGIAGEAIARGKLINVPDVTREARFKTGTGRAFRALMVAPLMMGDQCMGTLSIDSQVPAAFSPDDEKLLSLLGSQAAVAVRNAQLFSEAQRLSGDLQKSLEELKEAQALLIQ